MAIEERKACGLLTEKEIGETIKVSGWVNRRRDYGRLIFIDLRDRSGLLQIIFNEQFNDFETVEKLRNEYVIEVIGTLIKRSEETINPKLPTGSIELLGSSIKLLNKAKTPVFDVNEETSVDENIRLKYRYLDLRRPEMQKNIVLRHNVTMTMRRFLDERGFLEIETPILAKSTPEGARDYLVPSRVYPGNFFALPQSPQQYKQILMVAGMEKYFQIARCFRDEDLRADRQPEFTQLDMEMSFINREDVMTLATDMIGYIFKETLNKELPLEFPSITYNEAMNRYGSDRPDLRFDLPLYDIGAIVANTDFKAFKNILDKGGVVKGINGKGCSDIFSRKDIDNLTSFVNVYGAKGLACIAITEDGIKSIIAKFLSKEELEGIIDIMGGEKGDLLMFVADKKEVVHNSLGSLRIEIAKRLDLIDENELNFVWVTDFPLFKYDEDKKRYVAIHHMFTHPNPEDIDKLESDPISVRALAYDLVLNGIELGASIAFSGSLNVVKCYGVLKKVIIPLLTSPILGFFIAFVFMKFLYFILKRLSQKTVNKCFSKLQVLSAGFMAFAHGSNDAQKSMGIITLALVAGGYLTNDANCIPLWVKLSCAITMGIGTSIGGWRIIKTMGINMIRLQPIGGFAAETSAAIVIETASHLGMPLSTTHVISTSIMGVGTAKRTSAVRWLIAKNIIGAWILTIPITVIISAIIMLLLKGFAFGF